MRNILLAAVVLCGLFTSFASEAHAQRRYNNIDPRRYDGGVRSDHDPRLSGDVPAELRELYRNPDGSCVQCSIGMCGIDANVPEAYTLLVDSEFGSKVRGGSWPGRVTEYAKERGIKCWNVTGRQTYDAMSWACDTGRCAAIGFKTSHFCTLLGSQVGRDGQRRWFVCDNNTPEKVDEYDDQEFRALHQASGPWCVILDQPPAPVRPRYAKWW
jgi:hypothetical protein